MHPHTQLLTVPASIPAALTLPPPFQSPFNHTHACTHTTSDSACFILAALTLPVPFNYPSTTPMRPHMQLLTVPASYLLLSRSLPSRGFLPTRKSMAWCGCCMACTYTSRVSVVLFSRDKSGEYERKHVQVRAHPHPHPHPHPHTPPPPPPHARTHTQECTITHTHTFTHTHTHSHTNTHVCTPSNAPTSACTPTPGNLSHPHCTAPLENPPGTPPPANTHTHANPCTHPLTCSNTHLETLRILQAHHHPQTHTHTHTNPRTHPLKCSNTHQETLRILTVQRLRSTPRVHHHAYVPRLPIRDLCVTQPQGGRVHRDCCCCCCYIFVCVLLFLRLLLTPPFSPFVLFTTLLPGFAALLRFAATL